MKKGPFSLDEARNAGLTRYSLRSKAWRRIGRGLYRWSGLTDDRWQTLSAWRRAVPEAVFTGVSAAWLFGLDLEPTDPVEIVVPASSGLRSRQGLMVHHSEIAPADVVTIRTLRALALPLTLAGLCLRLPAVEALIAIDMAVRRGLTDPAALANLADSRPGMARLRLLAMLAEPAESPMETRLRWLLIQAGLPRPEVQTVLTDGSARFAGRADLYYPEARLILEYDGENHRDRLVDDDRRQNGLVNAGYRVLRFTSADIYRRGNVVVAQVRDGLTARSGSGSAGTRR